MTMEKKTKTPDGFCSGCGRAILSADGKCEFCGYQLPPEEIKAAKHTAAGMSLPISSKINTRAERVVITGIDINFFSLSLFLTRLMLAAIPAAILAGMAIGFLWWFWVPLLALHR